MIFLNLAVERIDEGQVVHFLNRVVSLNVLNLKRQRPVIKEELSGENIPPVFAVIVLHVVVSLAQERGVIAEIPERSILFHLRAAGTPRRRRHPAIGVGQPRFVDGRRLPPRFGGVPKPSPVETRPKRQHQCERNRQSEQPAIGLPDEICAERPCRATARRSRSPRCDRRLQCRVIAVINQERPGLRSAAQSPPR